MHTGARLGRALARVEPTAYRKKLKRVVAFDAIRKTSRPRLLYDEGPLNSPEGQRFTPPRPDSHRGIYASTTLLTAGAEFAGSVTKWELGDCANAVTFTMVTRLMSLLDLWEPKVRDQLGTTRAELQSPWLGHFKLFGTWPPTWTLGKAVFDSGRFDGIRFFSNRNAPNGRNVVVLTDRLDGSASYVRIYDQNESLLEAIPPSS